MYDNKAVSQQGAVARENKMGFYAPLLSIGFSNLLIIFIAIKNNLVITDVIWIYWCEGVIIGSLLTMKFLTMSLTSIECLKRQRDREFSFADFFSGIFVYGQVPLHIIIVKWIYSINPRFDYSYTLAVMGSIILGKEIFLYFRDSHPWEEPGDDARITLHSCMFFIRFIPVLALYHYLAKTKAGEDNMALLTIEFTLFKFASEVIAYLIEGYIRKRDRF
jgi:hypothetical protein